MAGINYSDLAFETMDLGQKLDHGKKVENLNDGPGLIFRKIMGPETYLVKGFTTENIKNSFANLSSKNLQKLGLEIEQNDIKFYPTYSVELADNLVAKIINQRFSFKESLVRNISDPGSTSWMSLADDGFKICMSYPGGIDNFINIGVLGSRKEIVDLFGQTLSKLENLIPEHDLNCSEVEISLKVQDKTNFYFQSLMGIFQHGKMENEIIEYFGPYLDNHLLDFLMEISSLRGLWKELE